LAIQNDDVQAYMWLGIAVTRAVKHPARVFSRLCDRSPGQNRCAYDIGTDRGG